MASNATLTTALGVAILALRMLGLFMVVPVFSLLAQPLEAATPMLIGTALGIYGLTQALLQVPLGYWSDRVGRRPIIVGGLLLFIAGSLIAAVSDSIWGVLLGRLLQGAGAIASTVIALIADSTEIRQRTRAMAMVGAGMGGAFLLAIVVGPWLAQAGSLALMFQVAAGMGIFALLLAMRLPATAARPHPLPASLPASLAAAIGNARFQPWYLSIFLLHLSLTLLFVVMPLLLTRRFELDPAGHGHVYLLTMLGSFMVAIPALLFAERIGRGWSMRLVGIGLLAIGVLGILRATETEAAGFGLFVFFCGFNMLEASLPSALSKRVERRERGLVMGVFASSQFLGTFAGGMLGGILLQAGGESAVLAALVGLALTWLLAFLLLARFWVWDQYILELDEGEVGRQALFERLRQLPGVTEVVVDQSVGSACLKVDRREFDPACLWRDDIRASEGP